MVSQCEGQGSYFHCCCRRVNHPWYSHVSACAFVHTCPHPLSPSSPTFYIGHISFLSLPKQLSVECRRLGRKGLGSSPPWDRDWHLCQHLGRILSLHLSLPWLRSSWGETGNGCWVRRPFLLLICLINFSQYWTACIFPTIPPCLKYPFLLLMFLYLPRMFFLSLY